MPTLLVTMIAPIEQVDKLMENIKNDKEVEDSLVALRIILSNLNPNQLSELTRDKQLGILFDCLNSSNEKQIQITCEILKTILRFLPTPQLLTQYRNVLLRALGHPMKEVKVTILQELRRTLADGSLINLIEEDNELLLSIRDCLCHEDLSVGNLAIQFLSELAKAKHGQVFIKVCKSGFLNQLMENTGGKKEIMLRIVEVLVKISSASPEALYYLEQEGFSDRLLSFLDKNDVLAMLALVNVFTELALTPHGWNFLLKHKVIKHLVEPLATYEEDVVMRLAYPGIAKFFGQIGEQNPGVLKSSCPEIFDCLYNAINKDNDFEIIVVSLEVIGMIAYKSAGKIVLSEDESKMRRVMERMHEAINLNHPSEMRVRALHALSNIIHLEMDSFYSKGMEINEIWFSQLGSSAIKEILSMASQPFVDLKTGALSVLLRMANQKWGQVKFRECSGALDFLLDRKSEKESNGLLMKHDILKAIVSSETGESVFNSIEYAAILEYVRQGPYYSPPTTEVAVEDAV